MQYYTVELNDGVKWRRVGASSPSRAIDTLIQRRCVRQDNVKSAYLDADQEDYPDIRPDQGIPYMRARGWR